MMVKCKLCGEEIEWVKSKKTGKKFPINIGKTSRDKDYFHSKTCKGRKEVKKEITVGDILNNHELRLRQLEATMSKMLEYFGRLYIEGEKK